MPVTAQDVREVLPQATGISDGLIDEFVTAWQARADIAIGTSTDPKLISAVGSAVRLGAASDVLRALWSGTSADEPGNARAMRKQAEEVIAALDATTSVVGEPGLLGNDLVSESSGAPLWAHDEFYPPSPRG